VGTLRDIDNQRRIDITRTVMTVLDSWGVDAEDQIALLDLPTDTRPRQLNRYRNGTPLPEAANVLLRVHYLLAIDNALHNTYPHNSEAASYWVTTPNMFFNRTSPLQVMLKRGSDGIQRIIDHLDGQLSWH